MQEALPFRTYVMATTTRQRSVLEHDTSDANANGFTVALVNNIRQDNYLQKLVRDNSVIVFGKKGCCMCHVVKRLLQGLGVNPTILEVDDVEEAYVINELSRIDKESGVGPGSGGPMVFPVVFVGGKLFGGLDRVMSTHISGTLVPILKDARALWL